MACVTQAQTYIKMSGSMDADIFSDLIKTITQKKGLFFFLFKPMI